MGTFAWVDADGRIVPGMVPEDGAPAEGVAPITASYVDPKTGYLWSVRVSTGLVGWWPNFTEPYLVLYQHYTSTNCTGEPYVNDNLQLIPTNVPVRVLGLPDAFVLPPALPTKNQQNCSFLNAPGTCQTNGCFTAEFAAKVDDLIATEIPELDANPPLTFRYFP